MVDGAGKRKSAKRQKEKSKSGGGKKHGRKAVFWLGASVFSFLDSDCRLAVFNQIPIRHLVRSPFGHISARFL
jgi:hypothetical protein